MLTGDLRPAEYFNRRPSVRRFWSVVVKPTRMILVRPMQKGVLHHGSRLFGDGADRMFSNAVLMMCTDAGEVELLIDESCAEFVRLEDSVVAMVALYCFPQDFATRSKAFFEMTASVARRDT